MEQLFGTNLKLADRVPTPQQNKTITAVFDLLDLIPEEEVDETNKSVINALNVQSHLHTEVTDPSSW